MMKQLLRALVAGIALALAPFTTSHAQQSEPPVTTAVINKAAFSVVAIMDSHMDKFCSGFVIDTERGYVLTADHCLSQGLQVYDAALVDGVQPEEICHDPENDLSLLQVKTEKPGLLPRREAPTVGQPVVGLGFPGDPKHGGMLVAVVGLVQMLDFTAGGRTWLLTGIGEPGMSGGPIIDADGRVVGMIQHYIPGHDDLDFGNSAEDLVNFVVNCGVYNQPQADRVASVR